MFSDQGVPSNPIGRCSVISLLYSLGSRTHHYFTPLSQFVVPWENRDSEFRLHQLLTSISKPCYSFIREVVSPLHSVEVHCRRHQFLPIKLNLCQCLQNKPTNISVCTLCYKTANQEKRKNIMHVVNLFAFKRCYLHIKAAAIGATHSKRFDFGICR